MSFNSIIWSNNRYYLKCAQHMKKYHFRWEAEGAELSLLPDTCKFIFGAHRKHKILGTLAHTFTCLPWVFIQILPVLPLSQHRLRLRQRFWHSRSPACWRRKPDYTLSFSRLVFAFTFSVVPHPIDSPSYLTHPPITGRLSGRILFKQSSKP